MAMRMTAKQKEKARRRGIEAFNASLYMVNKVPDHFPLQVTWRNNKSHSVTIDWNQEFQRNDITSEQAKELDILAHEGYEKSFHDYMFKAMTPQTKEEFDGDLLALEALGKLMTLFAKPGTDQDLEDYLSWAHTNLP